MSDKKPEPNKKPEPYGIAKDKEAMDTLRKLVNPELVRRAEEISNRPASPAEQKVIDEMAKKIREELKKKKD